MKDKKEFEIINETINKKIKLYRLSESKMKSLKREIHDVVFPIVKRMILHYFHGYPEHMEDFEQEAGLIINKYIEDSSYDPDKGGSFIQYIKSIVIFKCWSVVFFSIQPMTSNKKAFSILHSALKKLREQYPEKCDEDLIMIFTQEKFGHLKTKSLAKKYSENLALYCASKSQNIAKHCFNDESDFFEGLSYEYDDSDSPKEEIFELVRIVKELSALPKTDKNHLTPLERMTIIVSLLSALKGYEFTSKQLAEKTGVKPSSFSRAFTSACSKINYYRGKVL